MKLVTGGRGGSRDGAGRPHGAVNKTTPEMKQLALPFADEAMNAILSIMRDDAAPPAVRLAAAVQVLDRAYGKPRQEVEQVGTVEPMQIVIKHWQACENDLPPDAAC